MSRRLMTNHVCSLAVILLCAQTAGSADDVEPPAGSLFPATTIGDGWTAAETDRDQPRTRNVLVQDRIPVATPEDPPLPRNLVRRRLQSRSP